LEYTYTYDWIDGTYYNWAWKYMIAEGGVDSTTGEEFFDILVTTASSDNSYLEKYRFTNDFVKTLKYM